eukprot:3672697-Rhodomonas_salina.4
MDSFDQHDMDSCLATMATVLEQVASLRLSEGMSEADVSSATFRRKPDVSAQRPKTAGGGGAAL